MTRAQTPPSALSVLVGSAIFASGFFGALCAGPDGARLGFALFALSIGGAVMLAGIAIGGFEP